ncbi:hypothetical protein Cni_G01896 [Canna indica]|uniref:Uncharacterized protein n=1 Tax=Canna indica TaxID=4628 RepID=A0AAQ3Q272_9LILI|nr:hypothetical protein Cni_G01896 [Canna indica]
MEIIDSMVFETKDIAAEKKECNIERKKKEMNFDDLSEKMRDSFSKISENKFAEGDFLEFGMDPEVSRVEEGRVLKARRGSFVQKRKNLVNVPVSFKNIKNEEKKVLERNKCNWW